MTLTGKRIVLGVSGGIAAYKACTICSQLTQKGAEVHVVMTESATQFVRPLTFQSLSRQRVHVDTFDEQDPSVVQHINLADHADLCIVAPATANVIGKLANGIADDMLTTILLATEAPVWVAPAMNGHMYAHPAVERNMNMLKKQGVHLLEPGEGQLACGYVGKGRMAEPEEIIDVVNTFFQDDSEKWWKNRKVLVTAGPTQEALDPVRYLTNRSSGKMGYAIAEQAARLGAQVTLVSGPVSLAPPEHVQLIQVTSAQDMYAAVLQEFPLCDVVFKAAAVVDYKPLNSAVQKIKKNDDNMVLSLKKTKDILGELGQQKDKQILVGFAAETENVDQYAQQKLIKKNADFIVANDVTAQGAGFDTDTNVVTIYHRSGHKQELPVLSKTSVALELLKAVKAHQQTLHAKSKDDQNG